MADQFRIHKDSKIKTVGELLKKTTFYNINDATSETGEQGTSTTFLAYKGGSNKTNRERVYDRYTPKEEKDQEGVTDDNLLLKISTIYSVPRENIKKDLLFKTNSQVIVSTDYKAFMSSLMQKLLTSPSYQKSYNLRTQEGSIKNIMFDVSAYMWCRALSSPLSDEAEGLFINISPFIENISINTGNNGAGFSITLSPIVCHYNSEKGWIISKKIGAADNFISDVHIYKAEAKRGQRSILQRNHIFFHHVIQANDMVFLSYETLDIEKEDRERTNKKFQLNREDIPNKLYDLIGFVDNTHLKNNFSSNDVSVEVKGRDLTKMIIDDGSYFFPLEFSQNTFYYSGNNPNNKKLFRRIITQNGKVTALNAYLNRSLAFSMQFIIAQLSNTGLVPDSVFSGYSNGVKSRRYKLSSDDSTINQDSNKFQDGAWQIVKVIIDEAVQDRRIVDSSIAQEQGSIIKSIRKLCQWPFVEFFTDTYGDQFYFIIRKPPFDRKGWFGLIYGDAKGEEDNLIPPPPTSKAIMKMGEGGTKSNDLVIDIEEEDIFSEELHFNDDEIFSWFRILPGAKVWGKSDQMAWAYLPAFYFPEYVDIWGSKPLMIESNYLEGSTYGDAFQNGNINYLVRQGLRDTAYVIESHQYLPFTRKGTITLNGDRRIKKNFCIRHKGTGEIFYVKEVQHNASISTESIDRTTTITVERGMVEKYIKPKKVPGIEIPVSYFNIIDTNIEESFSRIEIKKDEEESDKVVFVPSGKVELEPKGSSLADSFKSEIKELQNFEHIPKVQVSSNKNPEKKQKPEEKEKLKPKGIRKTREIIAEHFEVRKDIFNFFLKRRQFEDN